MTKLLALPAILIILMYLLGNWLSIIIDKMYWNITSLWVK